MPENESTNWPAGIIAQLRAIDEEAMHALPYSVKAIVTKAASDIERLVEELAEARAERMMADIKTADKPKRCAVCGRFIGKSGCWVVVTVTDPKALKEALGL